jgi:hypothetical protein
LHRDPEPRARDVGYAVAPQPLPFLGYSMQDWNLRVILNRIWGEQKLRYKSWAIQRSPDQLDREFWEMRGVDVYDVPLESYVPALKAALTKLRRMPATP